MLRYEHKTAAFDVIVIGGSYAGLSVALQIARARRRVLVIDGGIRRNRFATTSHGFLGQNDRSSAAIANDGRAELLAYPTAEWLGGTAVHAEPDGEGFLIRLLDGQQCFARRRVLALGVTDTLPATDGLAERWGTSVFHCLYRHGYELKSSRSVVLGVDAVSFHQAMLLGDWGKVTFFVDSTLPLDDAQRDALQGRGVTKDSRRVARISERATVKLADGMRVELGGLFSTSRVAVSTDLASRIGYRLEEGPLGRFIWTRDTKQTSVPDVFACGDAARTMDNVALSVGDGAIAGIAAHQSLAFGGCERSSYTTRGTTFHHASVAMAMADAALGRTCADADGFDGLPAFTPLPAQPTPRGPVAWTGLLTLLAGSVAVRRLRRAQPFGNAAP